jgi:hypothetical protein
VRRARLVRPQFEIIPVRRQNMAENDVTVILDQAGVEYELLPHPRTETAAAEAEALGIETGDVAKTLVISTPGGYVRTVLPASERIDLHKLREHLEGGKRIHLATEEDLREDYPDFELGAVPPFGGAATGSSSTPDWRSGRASCSKRDRMSSRCACEPRISSH